MEVLKGKCFGRLGMCTTIFLGLDPWVPTSPEFTPRVNPHYQSLVSLHVSYWTTKNRHSWNKYKIGQILNALDAQSILSMPPITSNARDQLIWTCTPSGNFSVKSADWQISELHAPPYLSPWRRWWQLNLPPRLLFFGWRIGHNLLPTKENLFHRKILTSTTCPLCSNHEESLSHLFKDSTFTRAIWFGVLATGLIP